MSPRIIYIVYRYILLPQRKPKNRVCADIEYRPGTFFCSPNIYSSFACHISFFCGVKRRLSSGRILYAGLQIPDPVWNLESATTGLLLPGSLHQFTGKARRKGRERRRGEVEAWGEVISNPLASRPVAFNSFQKCRVTSKPCKRCEKSAAAARASSSRLSHARRASSREP